MIHKHKDTAAYSKGEANTGQQICSVDKHVLTYQRLQDSTIGVQRC